MLITATASKKARLESAREWIELAIATGHDPYMIQQQDGHWRLRQRVPRAFSSEAES